MIRPATRRILALLQTYESRNVTFIEPDGSWPIVWDRARGVHVWDAQGRKYLDLTAAFGVAAAGHANPRVVAAGQHQMARLLHAMGDVHPHALKAELARKLSRMTFERWAAPNSKLPTPRSGGSGWKAKTIFCNSGFEAVEAALKTALLATGKPGIIAFTGAYHGLGYGALNATHRAHFRSPFRNQLGAFGHFVTFPVVGQASRLSLSRDPAQPPDTREVPQPPTLEQLETEIVELFRRKSIGAILVEPIQVRGGINIPPPEFLPLLRQLCDRHGALLILDEIYTGFGRTGKWFACEHAGIAPDVVCLGKALTGGFPLSACVGRADIMDAAWPVSNGEAIHTSTFLGHPVGCAMALAQLREIETRGLVAQSAELGHFLLSSLSSLAPPRRVEAKRRRRPSPGRGSEAETAPLSLSSRGLGLLAGIEFWLPNGRPATQAALSALKEMLRRGFILLPEGEHANVLSLTPPLTISQRQLAGAVRALAEVLAEADRR